MNCQHPWEVVVDKALAGDEWEYEYEWKVCPRPGEVRVPVTESSEILVCREHADEEYGWALR